MKRFIYILCCFLLLSFPSAKAGIIIQGSGGGAGTSDPCVGGSPGDPGDILCESFEDEAGDGLKDTSWNAITDSGADCVVTLKGSHRGTWDCPDRGDDVIKIDVESSVLCGIDRNFTEPTKLYISFAFRVDSWSGFDDTEYIRLIRVERQSDGGTQVQVAIYNYSGTIKLQLYHKANDGTPYFDPSALTISTGTWYRVRVYIIEDSVGTGLQWWTATNDGSFSEEYVDEPDTQAVNNFVRVFVGSVEYVSTLDAFDIDIDNVIIDNDAFTDNCD